MAPRVPHIRIRPKGATPDSAQTATTSPLLHPLALALAFPCNLRSRPFQRTCHTSYNTNTTGQGLKRRSSLAERSQCFLPPSHPTPWHTQPHSLPSALNTPTQHTNKHTLFNHTGQGLKRRSSLAASNEGAKALEAAYRQQFSAAQSLAKNYKAQSSSEKAKCSGACV